MRLPTRSWSRVARAVAMAVCLLALLVPATAAARRDKIPPTAPTGLVATGAIRQIDLRWNASTDNVGVTQYRVYRGGVQIATTGASTRTYADLAVTPGTVYSYTIRAADAARNLSAASIPAQASATDSPIADTEAPTIQVTYPAAGATLAGTVTLSADAYDNVGVTQAKWYIDGVEVASDGAAPWAQAWNTTSVSDGAHTVFAKAADAAGNWGTSAVVSFTVTNAPPPDTQPPSAPTSLQTSAATTTSVTLTWSGSSDNVGVAGYHVYLDSSLQAAVTATSYTFGGLACGTTHTLGVDAYDAAGNTSTRAATSGTTADCPPPQDTQPPTVQVTYPTAAATLAGTVTLTADAQDNLGVTQVSWYVDGAQVASDTATPWSQSWNSASVADGAHTVVAKARDAAGNWGTSAAVPVTVANAVSGTSVIATVGDITSSSSSQAVEGKVAAANPAAVLITGDYDNGGSPATLSNILSDVDPFYGPKPGGLYPIMYPTAGPTHDVSSCTSWAGYQQYWGKDPTKPYSFDVAGWHVMSIPSIVAYYNCGLQAVTDWINADLAAHTNQCTIAYWHQPYFTSTTTGHGPESETLPWVQALYDHGVDILVAGHQNSDFEAFYPQTPQRTRDDAHGIQAFVAGTGGQTGYTYTGTAPNSITKASGVYGPLILTLRSGSYDWKFDQAVGSGYAPSGSGTCRDAAPASP